MTAPCNKYRWTLLASQFPGRSDSDVKVRALSASCLHPVGVSVAFGVFGPMLPTKLTAYRHVLAEHLPLGHEEQELQGQVSGLATCIPCSLAPSTCFPLNFTT